MVSLRLMTTTIRPVRLLRNCERTVRIDDLKTHHLSSYDAGGTDILFNNSVDRAFDEVKLDCALDGGGTYRFAVHVDGRVEYRSLTQNTVDS